MSKIKPLYPQEQLIVSRLNNYLDNLPDNTPKADIPELIISWLQTYYSFYQNYRATDSCELNADGELLDVQQLEVPAEDMDDISVVIIDQDTYTTIAPNTKDPHFDVVVSGCEDFQDAIRQLIDRLGFHHEFYNEEGDK